MAERVERATKASRTFALVATPALIALVALPWWGDAGWMRLIAEMAYYLALALGIAMIFTAIAGVLFAIRTIFDPAAGPIRLILAFEAVIIGGLGNMWGTLIGGVVLGIAQAVGGALSPTWQILAGHIAFLVILIVRPSGLFPRTKDL